MAHCDLCNKNTRCSCKWGGCPSCNSTNKQVSLMNALIKLWVSKDIIRQRMTEIRTYVDKIDDYTVYEYLTNVITEEEFNQAVADYKTAFVRSKPKRKESEVVDTTWRVNPERACVFKGTSPWDRCIYCNSIRKYMKGKECPKYTENQGSTDAKNE